MTPREQIIEEAKRDAQVVRESALSEIACADSTVEDFEKYLTDDLAAEALAKSKDPFGAYQYLIFGGRISALRKIQDRVEPSTASDKIYEAGRAEHAQLEGLLGPVRRRTNERWARGLHVTMAGEMPEELATLCIEVFQNSLDAWHYLTTSAPGLQGQIPLEVAQSEAGLAEVIISLRHIDHGIAS